MFEGPSTRNKESRNAEGISSWTWTEDELEEAYRHFDECGECVSWLAGGVRVAAYEPKRQGRGRQAGVAACSVGSGPRHNRTKSRPISVKDIEST